MQETSANAKMVTKLLYRLLPVQILLNVVGSVNGIVSSIFATNYVGIDAMTAVGLYNPLNLLATSLGTILIAGSAILCGKYLGMNEQKKMQNVFSLNLIVSLAIALVFIVAYLLMSFLDLSFILTRDPVVRPIFNRYLLGQAIGMIPLMLGNSFAAFLSIENKTRRNIIASLVYIGVNILLNFLFVQVLHMEAFGLALASALGMWVFLAVQAQAFLTGKSYFRFQGRKIEWKELGQMVRIGLPGAAVNLYQTARGLIVNHLLDVFVGSVGISAFAAANNFLNIFWAIPAGMLAVSRMIISVSAGEEDRKTLTDVMRVLLKSFVPLMCAVVACLIICAPLSTRLFFHDPAQDVFGMTVRGLRILPLCMPFSLICMHFTCYGQTFGKDLLIHITAFLDGVVCVAAFTALLIPFTGVDSVYIANVLNGIVVVSVFIGYAWVRNRHFPKSLEELIVIPEEFGTEPDQRMDLTIRSMEDVVTISESIQRFCTERGISRRSAYLAGLAMEEMAGNVVDHGFTKDKKKHTVDVRVVHKDDQVILRIKDDCVPFDPGERQKIAESDDITKNIGIRMIFKIAGDIQYQNILGMNVLTIRISE